MTHRVWRRFRFLSLAAVAALLFEAGFVAPAAALPPPDAPPVVTLPTAEAAEPTPEPAPAASPSVHANAVAAADPTLSPTTSPIVAPDPNATQPLVEAATPEPADDGTIGLLPPLPAGAVEVVDRRTETSRTYRDPTGKTISELLDGSTWTRTALTYDAAGNVLTETTDSLGDPVTTRFTYNASNDVLTTEIADGTPDEVVTTQEYDTAGTGGTPGHLVKVTANSADPDPAKRQVTEYSYWPSDLLRAELAPDGVVTTHEYVGANETVMLANCTGGLDWKTCDGTGTPSDPTANVATTWEYTGELASALGLPTKRTDPTGSETDYVYDALARTTSETPPEGTTSREWDQLADEIRTTEPGSLVTTRTLDLANRVTTEVAPLRTTTTQYDATGAVTQTTTANDTVSQTYDAAGQLVAETIDPGSAPHLNLTSEHAYDAAGQEIASRDPDLTVTRTFYDEQGRVTKTVHNCTTTGTTVWAAGDPAWKTCIGQGTQNATWNLTTTYEYDERGNRTKETAPNGLVTTSTYDDLDRLVKVVDNDVASPTLPSEDVTTEYAYDANGNQAAVKSPTAAGGALGYRITRSSFDALGRVTAVIENCTEVGTTPPGDPAWRTCSGAGTKNAATNVETTFTYDADGHRLSVTGPSPATTSGTSGDYLATTTTRSAYDDAGRLCRVLENASVDLQSLADPCTTPVSGTATSNVSTRYTYDTRGNLATMVDGRGNTTTYGYDNLGRMTSLTEPGVTALVWAYNDTARTKVQTNRSSGSVTWTTDAAGRTISRAYQDASGAARTTTYAYTGGGAAWTATDGSTVSVVNDRLGRPTSVTVAGDTAATTSYGYHFTAPTRTDASGAYTMTLDRAGRITAIDDPIHTPNWTFAYGANGEPVTTGWPTMTALATTSAFDALGRLLTRTTNPGPRAAYTETYNRSGNRLTEASTITGDPGNGTATTGYDPLGRLSSYALPGIRTLGAGFDAVPNRTTLTTDGVPLTTTFSAANRPTSGGYAYDADGRMTTRPGSMGTTFSYDSLGRLAEVRQNPGNTLVARYTYDALDRLLTVERGSSRIRFRYQGTSTATAQVVDDIGGSVVRNVTTGPEGTVLMDWSGTDRRLYGVNGHHDTTFTTDDAGTVSATLRYDPWGNLLRSSGSLPDWRFQGSWLDTSTGLLWSVARWYDPVQGTFITPDTLLGEPESPASRHLYAYAQGDPVGGWDPWGLSKSATWDFDASSPFGRAWSNEDGTWVGNERGKLRMVAHAHSQFVSWVDSAAEASIRVVRRTPLLTVAERTGRWRWVFKANANYAKSWDAIGVFGGTEHAVRVEFSVQNFSKNATLKRRTSFQMLTNRVGCGYVLIGQLNRCSGGFGFDSDGVDEIASSSFVPPAGSVGPYDRIGIGVRGSAGVTAWFAWGETTLRLSDLSFQITWGS